MFKRFQLIQSKKSLWIIGGGSLLTVIGIHNYLKDRAKCLEYGVSSSKLLALKFIPWNIMSRCAGFLASCEIPIILRSPLFGTFSYIFGCNLEEMKASNLKAFPTFNHFFTRELKEGARRIDKASLVSSPCDGKILAIGKISSSLPRGDFKIDQVKGVSYPLSDLIGKEEVEKLLDQKKEVYFCTMYLSPSTYHRFHSPINNWIIDRTRRINGELFPVAPWFLSLVKEVSFLNERVVFSGAWKHGRFSMIPVGATNVGGIVFEPLKNTSDTQKVQMGTELGRFQLGSMVILVFSGPNNLEWQISPGQSIKLGQGLLRKRYESWFSGLTSFAFFK